LASDSGPNYWSGLVSHSELGRDSRPFTKPGCIGDRDCLHDVGDHPVAVITPFKDVELDEEVARS